MKRRRGRRIRRRRWRRRRKRRGRRRKRRRRCSKKRRRRCSCSDSSGRAKKLGFSMKSWSQVALPVGGKKYDVNAD